MPRCGLYRCLMPLHGMPGCGLCHCTNYCGTPALAWYARMWPLPLPYCCRIPALVWHAQMWPLPLPYCCRIPDLAWHAQMWPLPLPYCCLIPALAWYAQMWPLSLTILLPYTGPCMECPDVAYVIAQNIAVSRPSHDMPKYGLYRCPIVAVYRALALHARMRPLPLP